MSVTSKAQIKVSELMNVRFRPTCPICGRKNLRSVGKHIRKCH